MFGPRDRVTRRCFLRSGAMTSIGLIFFSHLLAFSLAFNNQFKIPAKTSLPIVVPPTRQLHSYGTRQKIRRHSAIPRPSENPSVEQNKSWEEVITHVPPPSVDHDEITRKDKVVLATTTGLAAFAMYTLLRLSSIGCWRYFVAGGICAATSHAIPTPLDVIKTRKQVDPSLTDKNFADAAREIMKTEGISALWAGLGPTAWGYLFEGALKFGVYEVLKPIFKSSLAKAASFTSMTFLNSQILAFLLCGLASGFAASVMLTPMEALRIRLVAEPDFAPNGWLEGGHKMLKQEGVSGLAKGFYPMIMKQVPYTVTKNVSFDIFTRFFYSIIIAQGIALTRGLTFSVPLVSAAVASILASISSQPGDMVLSLVNAHQGEQRPRDIYKSILRSERGVRGFFVGFKTRLLHVGIIVTLQLLIYDYVKRLCGIAATGL